MTSYLHILSMLVSYTISDIIIWMETLWVELDL